MDSHVRGLRRRHRAGVRRDVRRRHDCARRTPAAPVAATTMTHGRAGRAGSRRCRPATSTRASPSTSAARSGRSRSTSCRGSSRWTPWATIERGVQQRVRALEAFLADVYDAGQVLDDGVDPPPGGHHVRRTSTAPPPASSPPNGVRVHVSGIDLIRDDDGEFRVLEDNVRVPSGVSYVMTNRRAIAAALPETVRRATGSGRSPATRSGCSPRCARPPRPASPTRPSSCSPRASSTAPTSSTRCSPARWASSWSRAATWSAAAAG